MKQTQQTSSADIKAAVFGASGYSGAELVGLLHNHANYSLTYAFSSSASEPQFFTELYPQLQVSPSLQLQPWHPHLLDELVEQVRVVFLALPHEASYELADTLIKRGLVVIDLSGAFRLADSTEHQQAYGFARSFNADHFSLAECHTVSGAESLIAVPGCYPTVSGLALTPLMPYLAPHSVPVINAISGVTGAGKKVNLTTQFSEVSLQAYGIGTHRHQPEIAQLVNKPVAFTPHLGNFKRGILATGYVPLKQALTQTEVDTLYQTHYQDKPLVRLRKQPPRIQDVEHTPFCDIYAQVVTHGDTPSVIVTAVIDNLLKGAAAHALQFANLRFGLPETEGLI